MSWLRIDDRFAFNPKVCQLTRADRWTWVEVLCYCAFHKTDGRVPKSVHQVVTRANKKFIERCYEVGLLDLEEGGYQIHDWREYNPRDPFAAERMRSVRARKRANEGEQRPNGDRTETERESNKAEQDSNSSGPRAQQRACVPVPLENLKPLKAKALLEKGTVVSYEGADAEITKEETGDPPWALPSGFSETELAASMLLAAITDKTTATPRVVASFCARLPPASIHRVRESALAHSTSARYVVGALKRELEEQGPLTGH